MATKRKLNETITREFEEEIKNTKRYEGNIEDDIIPGKPKKYMGLNTKKAEAFLRARGADILDPAPRNLYHPHSIWKYKYCEMKDQSTRRVRMSWSEKNCWR